MTRALLFALAALTSIAAGGSSPLHFSLRDARGATHTERSWAGARLIVLFFIMPDCPVSQSYVPEMNRIAGAFGGRGVTVAAVQTDAAVPDDAVARHVREYGYQFPVLLDPKHVLVRHVGATITPEAAVLSPDGRVIYRGRIDNRVVSIGTRRPQATVFDLRDALEATLAGRAVAEARTQAVGCLIPPALSSRNDSAAGGFPRSVAASRFEGS
jgi:peroxiredoxin